ncbi:MAG TPA: MerR family transcriptional regulator [Bacteroidia bacterium]|jgi:DNA-binding transcriptional MerR regulator|nr:MerR family transcriptional regulator [Bacteroidia bacterium]
MPYKEFEDVKLYYSISEVADMFKVNASLIRFWEKEFDIIKPARNKKGNRMFTKEDVENFKLIFHLVKEKGFTLDGAKGKLKGDKLQLSGQANLHDSLTKVRNFLVELKETL